MSEETPQPEPQPKKPNLLRRIWTAVKAALTKTVGG